MSEKFDGVRAMWDGFRFVNILGKEIPTPEFMLKEVPQGTKFDGELWLGYGRQHDCVKMIKSPEDELWKSAKFLIFDCMSHPGIFEERYQYLKSELLAKYPPYFAPIPMVQCTGTDHLVKYLEFVEGNKGEGVMIRQPQSFHQTGRSETLQSVERQHDGEARVVSGETILANGTKFELKGDYPKEELSILSFKHLGYDLKGLPKNPTFWRQCLDKTWNDVVKDDIKYYLMSAPKNHNQPRCQGCKKMLGRDEFRIMVNGVYIATQANYTVSFCAKRDCIDQAFIMKKPTTRYPEFVGKIYVAPEFKDNVDHNENFNWVIGEKL